MRHLYAVEGEAQLRAYQASVSLLQPRLEEYLHFLRTPRPETARCGGPARGPGWREDGFRSAPFRNRPGSPGSRASPWPNGSPWNRP